MGREHFGDATVTDKILRMIELARGHVEAGGAAPADLYYRMVLKETSPPKNGVERLAHGEACVWNARKCLHNGQLGAATDWYRRALSADPLATDYRVEYCVKTLIPMGMHKNARIEAERATKLDPNSKEAWRTLGGMEHVLGNVAASIAAYDRQLELDPDNPLARLDRATIALDTADYDTVRKMCEPVLATDSKGDALHCLAMVAYREGRHEDAIALYDRAIAAGCYDPKLAEWNKSLALHSIGRYLEGWQAHEARGKQKTDEAMALMMRRFTFPLWNGEPAPARIHIHQEMGHGDVLAMARYISLLIERGYDVRLEVMESMVGLLQRSFPGATVMPKAADYPGAMGLPPFDYHLPMLSLPAVFKTDIDTVPWSGPYLKADPALARQYDARIGGVTEAGFKVGRRRVGLCWSSGIRQDGLWISEYGRRKSMTFEQLRPMFSNCQDNVFVSLQVGPEREQLHDPVRDLLPRKPDWDDTAALIECLDVVVTVDTAVAHLAGALGKPVLLMMHTEGSWHWMTKRADSPWYPTARIFRKDGADWRSVIDRIALALRNDKISLVA